MKTKIITVPVKIRMRHVTEKDIKDAVNELKDMLMGCGISAGAYDMEVIGVGKPIPPKPPAPEPTGRDRDIIGKSFTVKSCEARNHGLGNAGCVCHLIGKRVKIKRKYETPFHGTASYHLVGMHHRVRLSELGLPNRMA